MSTVIPYNFIQIKSESSYTTIPEYISKNACFTFNWNFYYNTELDSVSINSIEKYILQLDLKRKKFLSIDQLNEIFEGDQNLLKQINEKFQCLPEKYAKSKSAKV